MKKNIIAVFIFYFLFSFVYAETNSSAEIFLSNLEKLDKEYKNKVIPPYYTGKIPLKNNQALDVYRQSIPLIRRKFTNYLHWLLKKDLHLPHDSKLENVLNNSKALTATDLVDYFKPLIKNKQFKIENGDIVFLLAKKWRSLQLASVIESEYEHIDLIYINESGAPFVLEMGENYDLQAIPLSRYLIGVMAPNIKFAITRFNKDLDKQKMQNTLEYVVNNISNIYYDYYFITDVDGFNVKSYFDKSKFFYCGELVFNIYKYVTGSEDFDSRENFPASRYIKNGGGANRKGFEFLGALSDYFETKEKRDIIVPQNFLKSAYFTVVAELGNIK